MAMRRSYEALRSGRLVMLDAENASVLTYARVADDGAIMVVSLNMSPAPQTITVDLASAAPAAASLTTLLSSPAAMADVAAGAPLVLPPYAAWVAAVHSPQSAASRRALPRAMRG